MDSLQPYNLNHQLTLGIQLNDQARLADFCWTGNELVQAELEKFLSQQTERFLCLWGGEGHGKSYLLQACCQALPPQSSSIYLPLAEMKEWGAEVLEGLEVQDLICIDDLEMIAGRADWEEALFHLYNRIRDNENSLLLIAANSPPQHSAIKLADLRSRLSWGLVLPLHELTDEDKAKSLSLMAKKRGFDLPEAVVHYLLQRCSRSMPHLIAILDQLDKASLEAKRKITLPFVKQVLNLK